MQEFLFVRVQQGRVLRAVRRVQGRGALNQLPVGPLGVVQVLPREGQRLAVVALQAEEAVGQRVAAPVFQVLNGDKRAVGLAHLPAAANVQVGHVEPPRAPGVAQIALRLGNLVGVVRERVVHAAAVQVQILSVVLQGDGGALDVPARVARPPGGIPLQGLVLKLGFREPEDEVVHIALVGVLFHALPDAHGQVLLVVGVKDIIPPQFGGVKVHVSSGDVGVPLLL